LGPARRVAPAGRKNVLLAAVTLFELLDPEHERNMILQNMMGYTPIDAVSHPRRMESSATLL